MEETPPKGILEDPLGLIMLIFALAVDVGELFVDSVALGLGSILQAIPVVGNFLGIVIGVGSESISVMIDLVAIVFIGLWMITKGNLSLPRKKAGGIKITKWAKRLKWLRPVAMIIEVIPFLGALPLWTIAVYSEIKHGK